MRRHLGEATGWLLIVAAPIALIAHAVWMRLPVVDDAAISIGYGLTLWSGHGLRLTENSQPVEGFSSPAWAVLTGLAGPLHLDPLDFAWWLGLGCGALALLVFALWGPVSEGRRVRVEDGLGGFAPLTVLSLCFWVSSGMETGWFALMLALTGLTALLEFRKGHGWYTGVMLGLLVLTRPEGALFAALVGAWWLVRQSVSATRRWKQTATIAAVTVLIGGAYSVFRWFYFAEVLPNTFYAKSAWDFGVGGYLLGFYNEYQWLMVASALVSVVALTQGLTRPRGALAMLMMAGAALFSLKAKGDWMREWRFIVPVMPVLAVLFSAAVSAARGWWAAGHRIVGAFVWLIVFAAFGVSGLTVRKEIARLATLKASPEFPAKFVMNNAQQWKSTLDSYGAKRPLLGLPDVGGVSLVFRQAEVLDVAGLADYALAHSSNYAAMENYLFTEGAPMLIDAHGPSGHISFPKLRPIYNGWAFGLAFLPNLSPTTDSRCLPDKPTVIALSTEALTSRIEALVLNDPLAAIGLWRCAFTYRDDAQLPSAQWRSKVAELADQYGERVKAAAPSKALTYFSAATVLDGGNAHRRRKTEKLRETMFPKSPPVAQTQ